MPHYPPRPPPGIRRYIWDKRVLIESTFALSMMQPWEKLLIVGTLLITCLLFWVSVYTYYPSHLAYLSRRFAYYVYGDETADVRGMFWAWIKAQFVRAGEGVKGVVGGEKGRLEL
ncbi:hypothetical protein I316_01419 [Kwoniella heveanensis BCC8398]|uniref:Uncharacterized protein n=1 Tax=Kwoniella heveanensis BCC8398 TaxID=1296120 RepID=A0A1B9H0L0_9TREE|nr:hypothetical protein I316_01419 [Kwoniella heveanensis BCC8398]